MAYDSEAFLTDYLGGRLGQVVAEFRVTDVRTDRVRSAIDVVLCDAQERELVLFLERRVEGAACLMQTENFNLSYYPAKGVSDANAANAARAFGSLVREREAELCPDVAERSLRFSRAQPSPDRALELRINRECNEACLFCNTPADSDTILPSGEVVLELLERERRAGYTAVLFTGREPTLEPRLLEYVSRARELGYTRLRLQTNATRLGDRAYLESLVAAGITEVEISLHTRDAATFEALVGKRSLMKRTWAGLRSVLDLGVRCHVVLVATTMNLAEVPALLESLGRDLEGRLRHVTFSPAAPVGDGARRVDLVPRLSELREALPAIFAAAGAAGIELDIPSRCGLPLCAMPTEHVSRNAEARNTPGQTLEPSKRKAASCGQCRYDGVCTGVWVAYLERHGESELRPVAGA